ncbi:hypothetical protein [Pantoea sp. KPR_PJ]|uniref:hypothetical protein n=1 Tax=Pantoea sp. KPR_PJ TaxID=2738375 RepID=UPI003526F62B
MASSITNGIAGLGLVLMSTLPAVAAEGTVSLSGVISQEPCRVTPENSQLTVFCVDQGREQTQQVTVRQVTEGQVSLPGVTDISLTYMNLQKTQAVVQVDYN